MRRMSFSRTLLRVICWVCGNPVAEFLAYGLPPRPGRCPHCGAKPRNRAVHWYLREVVRPRLDANAQVLDVGGSRVAVQYLSAERVIGSAHYTVIDLRQLGFHAGIEPPHRFIRMDVTDTDFADASFDVILCNHTLPYVRNDREALAEIFRCLKADGLAMLDSSHDGEQTRPVSEYRREHPELGDDYFAENGDQWVYGKDYFARLENAGFQVRVDVLFDDLSSEQRRRHGLKDHHELIVAFKSPQGARRFTLPKRAPVGVHNA
jgi:SAM-dependent methyltransferase